MKTNFENITLGRTYQDKYLNTELGKLGDSRYQGLITISREKTSYGYKIVQATNYIAIYNTKLYIYPDGRAKSVTKVNKNYHAPYQYTLYYDKNGKEIKDYQNRTRIELHYWKNI